MERTKTAKKIPDAINSTAASNFTQISNNILRNPKLSAKAKGILCLLLSNQHGWHSYVASICSMMADGRTAIESGLKELEKTGYLKRFTYREKDTKIIRGVLWCYTDEPGVFDLGRSGIIETLETYGYELVEAITRKAGTRFSGSGVSGSGKPAPYNTNGIIPNEIILNHIGAKKNAKDKNSEFLPLAERLAGIIQSNKNIKVPSTRLHSWADEIRKLSQMEEIAPARIASALDWYAKNIGGQYVPIIESGSSLRNKFIKLEEAMKRAGAMPPSSSESIPDDGPSPKRLIQQYFNGLAPIFEQNCYLPAKDLISAPNTRPNKRRLAQALINLFEDIETAQSAHLPPNSQGLFPGAITLIKNYIEWIGENDWIKDRSIPLFNINHPLFLRFRRAEASKDNLERDPITGKSYMRE
jgi:hypothetical protein